MKVSKAEILAYAYECKRSNPSITSDELRTVLQERFIERNRPQIQAVGLASNPMDWLHGLRLIFGGLARLLDDKEPQGAADIIEGVITIVM